MIRTFLLVLLLVGAIAPRAAAPPEASPVASPTGPERAWQVIETREIAVDGDPVTLSPDGQWLAGTADGCGCTAYARRVAKWAPQNAIPAPSKSATIPASTRADVGPVAGADAPRPAPANSSTPITASSCHIVRDKPATPPFISRAVA